MRTSLRQTKLEVDLSPLTKTSIDCLDLTNAQIRFIVLTSQKFGICTVSDTSQNKAVDLSILGFHPGWAGASHSIVNNSLEGANACECDLIISLSLYL
jgi:hypothetical protein